jgi:hypothetical protein
MKRQRKPKPPDPHRVPNRIISQEEKDEIERVAEEFKRKLLECGDPVLLQEFSQALLYLAQRFAESRIDAEVALGSIVKEEDA